jgi:hypothetical protein
MKQVHFSVFTEYSILGISRESLFYPKMLCTRLCLNEQKIEKQARSISILALW